jgi:hypothetical protein
MKPQVFSKILNFLAEGRPIVLDEVVVSDTTILDTDDEGNNNKLILYIFY